MRANLISNKPWRSGSELVSEEAAFAERSDEYKMQHIQITIPTKDVLSNEILLCSSAIPSELLQFGSGLLLTADQVRKIT